MGFGGALGCLEKAESVTPGVMGFVGGQLLSGSFSWPLAEASFLRLRRTTKNPPATIKPAKRTLKN
jgi:hypothetical protein